MRTPQQTGILVGLVAGLVSVALYWLLQAPGLNGLLLLLEVLVAAGAGVAAALLQPIAPTVTVNLPATPPPTMATPSAPAALPSPRGQRVRAAAIAGAIAGLGWGLAGLGRVTIQLTDPALSSQLASQLAPYGIASTATTLLTTGLIIGACFALVLFPAVCAGLGALGGYVFTALRPDRAV